jgi:predicted ATPase/DNA-binding XRE family transcriptional regulator
MNRPAQPSGRQSFGALLRRYRTNAGLTQEQLAERAGLSRRGIADLERGARRAPYTDTVLRLAVALGLSEVDQASFVDAARIAPRLPGERELAARPKPTGHTLPLQMTALLGRQREVAAVRAQLLRDDVRLLTLTGPAGTGKTRLGVHVASELLDRFEDGVFFVPLAPVTEPELVAPTIAQTLGIWDTGARPVIDTLTEYLVSKQLLLVLDNFEQILAAAPLADHLLRAAADLKMLVTSRAPLEIHGEHEFPVPPLAVPDPARATTVEAVSQYGAVALFRERVTAIRPSFSLQSDNATTVAEICVRLDGLPLAIELAAARIRLLSPKAMLTRLEHRLPLLTGGSRDLPARQQTLRKAISWSYDLLDERDQALFRRLSLFVGGYTLEAAEKVVDAAGLGIDVLDGAASLVSKSLVRQDDGPEGEPRLSMLETIREFALEQLVASGEEQATRERHAAVFLACAEEAEPKLLSAHQVRWIHRLAAEHANFRAVLAWSRDGLVPRELGLRLVGALVMFWHFRGHIREARDWADAMLALAAEEAPMAVRGRAMYARARTALVQFEPLAQRAFAHDSASILKAAGDLQGAGRSLSVEALSRIGDLEAARGILRESADLAEQVGDLWGLAFALGQLGAVAAFQGDPGEARLLRQRSADLALEIGDRYTLGLALAGLAILARDRGELAESIGLFKECLTVSSELEDHWVLPRALAGLAGAARLAAEYTRSARLFGAVQALREADGSQELVQWREMFDTEVAQLRAAVPETDFELAWVEGRNMTLEQTIAYALSHQA